MKKDFLIKYFYIIFCINILTSFFLYTFCRNNFSYNINYLFIKIFGILLLVKLLFSFIIIFFYNKFLTEKTSSINKENKRSQLKTSLNQNKIAVSLEKWQSFFNTFSKGIIIIDNKLNIINCNKASFSLTGNNKISKVYKKKLIQVFKNSDLIRACEQFFQSKEKFFQQELSVFVNHHYVTIKISFDLIQNDEFNGAIIMMENISKVKESALIHKEFIANVSHELKTPITVIQGFSETLINYDDDISSNDMKKIHQKIYNNCHTMNNIIQNLLMLSKIEHQGDNPSFEEGDIYKSINNAIELCHKKIIKNKIEFIYNNKNYTFLYKGNHSLIEMAVRNLLENAINYTHNKIELKCNITNKFFIINIKDNGIGIKKTVFKQIFNRFYRVDPSRNRKSGGSGLGLSIVKHIMLIHQGYVDVESTLNKGSCFSLHFPIISS